MSPSTLDKPRARIALQPNPFVSTAVQSAWGEVPADVSQIHETAFRAILRALDQIRMGGQSTSIVVTGAAGSGKTHLLGRLRNKIGQDLEQGVAETIYIYVRCNASAVTLWRHLRFSLVSDLLKSGSLQRLLNRSESLDQVDNLNLERALLCLREGRHARLAAAWLRGESLTDEDSAALGIKLEPDDEERGREWDAELVTHALLGFLHRTPTVLCFDQVEGLETYLGEQTGFRKFGQIISELHSRHNQLLFLSCIVTDYEPQVHQSLTQSDKDRVFGRVQNLRPIEWRQAEEIVKARLDAAPALTVSRREHAGDPWWPLNPDPLKALFAATGLCLPRTLIQACRHQFDECMGDELSAGEEGQRMSLPDFLQEKYEKNLDESRRAALLEGADKVLGESLPWLLQNSGFSVLGPSPELPPHANLCYRAPAGDAALVFCFRRGNAFTNTLKRIDNRSWNPRVALKVLSDPAIQPKEGSVGAKLLSGLKQRGTQQIYPLPEALAALHAIRNLTTSARSGEFTLDGKPITEPEVTAWALSNLPPQLERLKAELTQNADADPVLPRLSALVAAEKVIEIEAAAGELSLPLEEIADCARRHPMHFGILEGPPLVLFEAVEGPSPEALHA